VQHAAAVPFLFHQVTYNPNTPSRKLALITPFSPRTKQYWFLITPFQHTAGFAIPFATYQTVFTEPSHQTSLRCLITPTPPPSIVSSKTTSQSPLTRLTFIAAFALIVVPRAATGWFKSMVLMSASVCSVGCVLCSAYDPGLRPVTLVQAARLSGSTGAAKISMEVVAMKMAIMTAVTTAATTMEDLRLDHEVANLPLHVVRHVLHVHRRIAQQQPHCMRRQLEVIATHHRLAARPLFILAEPHHLSQPHPEREHKHSPTVLHLSAFLADARSPPATRHHLTILPPLPAPLPTTARSPLPQTLPLISGLKPGASLPPPCDPVRSLFPLLKPGCVF
jgi:hypothetical protein